MLLESLDWFDIPLKFSSHAQDRAIERNCPLFDYLPVHAYCYGVKKKCVYRFAFKHNERMYAYVLNESGLVITVYTLNILPDKYVEDKFEPKKINHNKYPDKYISQEIDKYLLNYA